MRLSDGEKLVIFGTIVSMTADERKEFMYRIEERLGILAEGMEPTAEQREIAVRESEAWLRQSRGELL